MTRDEHLYTIAGEEGVEIAQRCSKAVRFGGTEVQPGQGMDNRQRILQEFADLVGVLELLGFDIGIPAHSALRPWIDAKKEKVEKFLAYSRECGTLETAESRAVLSPGGAAEKNNGNTFVFCDHVEDAKRNGLMWGCVRGAGHDGPHALCLPPYPQSPVLLQGAAEKDTPDWTCARCGGDATKCGHGLGATPPYVEGAAEGRSRAVPLKSNVGQRPKPKSALPICPWCSKPVYPGTSPFTKAHWPCLGEAEGRSRAVLPEQNPRQCANCGAPNFYVCGCYDRCVCGHDQRTHFQGVCCFIPCGCHRFKSSALSPDTDTAPSPSE